MPSGVYPRTKEHNAANSAAKKNKLLSLKHCAALSTAQKKRYKNPAEHAKSSAALKKLYEDPKEREKLSAAHIGKTLSSEHCAALKLGCNTPKAKTNYRNAHINKPLSLMHIAAISTARKDNLKVIASLKKSWQDPAYREKQLEAIFKGLKLLPNKPEKFLTQLFENIFPGEWKYTGAGNEKKYRFGGRAPDFVNINGQKKIIEFNGDYFHGSEKTGRTNAEEEQQQIAHYDKYGYQTLVIWECELQNINALCSRITEFVRG